MPKKEKITDQILGKPQKCTRKKIRLQKLSIFRINIGNSKIPSNWRLSPNSSCGNKTNVVNRAADRYRFWYLNQKLETYTISVENQKNFFCKISSNQLFLLNTFALYWFDEKKIAWQWISRNSTPLWWLQCVSFLVSRPSRFLLESPC